MKAAWNYFEAGHGKGPCDGIGAVAKRMADAAIKQGKADIQDAETFYKLASHTDTAVKYVLEPKGNIDDTLRNLPLATIKGTMKVHAVVGQGENTIKVRNTSCYCDDCFTPLDGLFHCACEGWELKNICLEEIEHPNPPPTDDVSDQLAEDISNGTWVAAVYEGRWYVGEVNDVKDTDMIFSQFHGRGIFLQGNLKMAIQ